MKRSKLRKNLIETEIMKIGAILNFRGTTVQTFKEKRKKNIMKI